MQKETNDVDLHGREDLFKNVLRIQRTVVRHYGLSKSGYLIFFNPLICMSAIKQRCVSVNFIQDTPTTCSIYDALLR